MIPEERKETPTRHYLEFKIYNPQKEKSLEDTVEAALKQIQGKRLRR